MSRLLRMITLAVVLVATQLVSVSAAVAAGKVVLHVDDDAAPGGNGSAASPFTNLPEAVNAARTLGGRVAIHVKPGDYPIATSLLVDFPVELRGSTQQEVAPGDPLPTGTVVPGTQTRVFASGPIGAGAMISVGRTDATVVSGVTIRGFVFQGTATGFEVQLTRVQDYLVADNVFRAPANFAFQSTASSGELKANHFSGVATGAIFTGGYPASPSRIVATGNRMVSNNLGGILLIGASFGIPELGDSLEAVVRGNDLSNNAGTQGFGMRMFILRRDPGTPGDTQSTGNIQALVQNNRMVGNRVGLTLDAGFPFRNSAAGCDPRVFSGTLNLELKDNNVTGNIVRDGLITFTRNTAALNTAQAPLWQFLHDSFFAIDDPQGTLAGAWIDHPADDPFLGPCPMDAVHEPLNNALIYNGAVLPNGKNF